MKPRGSQLLHAPLRTPLFTSRHSPITSARHSTAEGARAVLCELLRLTKRGTRPARYTRQPTGHARGLRWHAALLLLLRGMAETWDYFGTKRLGLV